MTKNSAFFWAPLMPLLALAALIMAGCTPRNDVFVSPTGKNLYMEKTQEASFYALQFSDDKVTQYGLQNSGHGVELKTTNQYTFNYNAGKRCGSFEAEEGTITILLGEDGCFYDETNKKAYVPMEGQLEDYLVHSPRLLQSDPLLVGPAQYCDTLIPTPVSLQGGNGDGLPFSFDALLKWALDKIGTYIITKTGNAIYDEIFSSAESQKLTQVLNELDTIQMQLNQLMTLYVNNTCEELIKNRSGNYVIPMKNSAHDCLEMLRGAATEEERKGIILKWGDNYGNNTQCKNFIDFLLTVPTMQKNTYQIYDLYAYNCYAFESDGYEMRENLRLCDASVIIQYAYLTGLYYMYSTNNQQTLENLTKDLTDKLKQYQAFCEANKVVRRDNEVVCQIEGAHFVMEKELVRRDYKSHPWFADGMHWDNEHGDAVWFVVNGDTRYSCGQTYDFCLKPKEITAISKFYKGSKKSLYTVLHDLGVTFPEKTNQQHYQMLLQGDGSLEHDEYNDYFIRANYSVNADAEDITVSNSENIGSAWLEKFGFLWMDTRFARWSNYDDSKCWVRATVTER